MTADNDLCKPLAPMVLGYTPMDDVHVEFVEVVQQAIDCSDTDFPDRLEVVVAHLKRHFEQEDRWMDETGFPPGDCHRDEHAKVLSSAAEVQALEPAQVIEVGREFIKALVDWFPNHADYLDSALAACSTFAVVTTPGGKRGRGPSPCRASALAPGPGRRLSC